MRFFIRSSVCLALGAVVLAGCGTASQPAAVATSPGAAASGREGVGAAMTEALAVAAIERVLARAERAGPAGTQDRELFALAGVETPGDAQPPVAAVALLGEDEPGDAAPARGWWLRADPVHLRADLTDLVLTDPAELDLAQDEAERLAAPLAAHLEQREPLQPGLGRGRR